MANDEEYRAAVAKGTRLLNMLPLGSESVTDISEKQEENARSNGGEGQSQFIVVEALEENDYIDMNSAYSSALPILAPVLKALGLDYEFQNDGGKNVAMNHTYVSGPSSLGELYSQPVSTWHTPLTLSKLTSSLGLSRLLQSNLQPCRWGFDCRLESRAALLS